MLWLCLSLIGVAAAISLPLTWLVRQVGVRLSALDSPGVSGQIKQAPRRVPNTGGIAIFFAVAMPMLAGLALIWFAEPWVVGTFPAVKEYAAGVREESRSAVILLTSLAWLHVLGVIDDRRPLGPFIKLLFMSLPAFAIPVLTETRLFEFLTPHVGGPWLSTILTALWILVVTNALNFMDNMDGLCGGVGAITSACFLAAALIQQQWFVAACLALLIGALLGFLVFNFPPASIFMGDGGSILVGYLLAFLTVRTTYYDTETGNALAGGWYGVFMPLIVLAVPIYDFLSVVIIRLRAGRSPFVGDLNHLSHRLVRLGLTKQSAVAVIYGFTTITGLTGVFLGTLEPWQALLAGVQTVVMLLVLALFEYNATRTTDFGP